jgi:hypothetical protein
LVIDDITKLKIDDKISLPGNRKTLKRQPDKNKRRPKARPVSDTNKTIAKTALCRQAQAR